MYYNVKDSIIIIKYSFGEGLVLIFNRGFIFIIVFVSLLKIKLLKTKWLVFLDLCEMLTKPI